MTHCRSIVGESLLLLVGESTQFTGKNSSGYPSTTVIKNAIGALQFGGGFHFGAKLNA